MTQVLARALASEGHEVRVIGLYPPDYPAANMEQDHGVKVWRLRERAHTLGWAFSRYKLYQKISEWARNGLIDLVEMADYQGLAAGWGRLPVPVIVRLHGTLAYFAQELEKPIEKTSYWLERASLRRADYVCSVCQYTAQRTSQVFDLPLDRSTVLYNPVEIAKNYTVSDRIPTNVIFSGTLTDKKGIISLINAWPRVTTVVPQAELHVFGKDGKAPDGGSSMREFLRSQLSDQNRACVHFHGHVSREELFNAYRVGGIAVFPSYAEAFAVAPLEAMACGCPTISSRRGSGPELLNHEREGLLVNPDSPEEIAGAILQLLADPSRARSLGDAGRLRVFETFAIERLIGRNVTFYEECVRDFREKSVPLTHHQEQMSLR